MPGVENPMQVRFMEEEKDGDRFKGVRKESKG